MSAFIMSDKAINSILNFIKNNSENGVLNAMSYKYSKYEAERNLMTSEHLENIGKYLLKYNYKSVGHRYKDNSENEIFDFNFKPHYQSISIAQFLKTLDCLEYQCCEPNDFYESDFYRDLVSLKQFGYRLIDGYEQAKWGE